MLLTSIIQEDCEPITGDELERHKGEPLYSDDKWVLVKLSHGQRVWVPVYEIGYDRFTDHSKLKIVAE